MADYLTTFSKIHINPIEPEIEKISLVDIAHALSLLCRANGHFKQFYSVGQHSINCANEAKERGLSKKVQLGCLLHDASEAYLSDVTRPVKKHLEIYQKIESVMEKTIYKAFGLDDLTDNEFEIIREIDNALLYYEFYILMGEKLNESEPTLKSKPSFSFKPFEEVEREFIKRAISNFENSDSETRQSIANIGVDGCAGGWICAILKEDKLTIKKVENISDIANKFKNNRQILVDMPIGLQSSDKHKRPDSFARKLIPQRASTIFSVPCRQAVYTQNEDEAKEINKSVLGVSFSKQSFGIFHKIRQIDYFLQNNPEYKNKILECHPEVSFKVLNGKTLLTKKSETDGIEERIEILKRYIPFLDLDELIFYKRKFGCNLDDIIDAICLAVVATFVSNEKYETIPDNPMMDETGILMQMIIPKI